MHFLESVLICIPSASLARVQALLLVAQTQLACQCTCTLKAQNLQIRKHLLATPCPRRVAQVETCVHGVSIHVTCVPFRVCSIFVLGRVARVAFVRWPPCGTGPVEACRFVMVSALRMSLSQHVHRRGYDTTETRRPLMIGRAAIRASEAARIRKSASKLQVLNAWT